MKFNYSQNQVLILDYLVATPQGYTKHYYSGSERIASAIGLGGLEIIDQPLTLENTESWHHKKDVMYKHMYELIVHCLHKDFDIAQNGLHILHNMTVACSSSVSLYFYHPDHLGSTSWITDRNGDTIQYLHYLPLKSFAFFPPWRSVKEINFLYAHCLRRFGEEWIDQRSTSWNAQYSFTGKIKDAETGYNYFGARYYDSGLSVWLSVDPLSDKYPTLSPYTYCANNPIMMVDPDGRQISVMFDNVKYTITGGKVYVNGNEFSGELPKIVQTVNTAINKIKETAIGREIMTQLDTDICDGGPDIIFQQSTENKNNYDGYVEDGKLVKATISISENSMSKPFIRKKDGSYNRNFIIWRTCITGSIMHELAHAYTDYIGTSMNGEYDDLDLNEWQACFYENMYYSQSQKYAFLRTHYKSRPMYDTNGNFLYERAEGPLLLEGMTPKDPRTFNINN